MSIRMFIHALRMVFSDLGASLRVTGPLYILAYILISAPFVVFMGSADFASVIGDPTNPPDASGGFALSLLIGVVGYIILSTWLAIAWHRYVLLGETGVSYPKGKVSSYFWRGLGYAIAAFLPTIVIFGMLVTAIGPSFTVAAMMEACVTIVGLYLLFRISMGLPGLCVDRSIDLQQSWRATAPVSGAILGMVVLIAVASTVVTLVLTALLSSGGLAVGLVINLVVGWVQLVVGLSMLTTIYGVAIEGRDLT